MLLYKFLDTCIKISNIEKLLSFILKNYKLFDQIKNLDDNLNFENLKIDLFRKDNYNNDNLILMYRILEKKFYNIISDVALRKLNYKDELNNDKSNNKYLVFATDNMLSFNILRAYLLFYYANLKINKD